MLTFVLILDRIEVNFINNSLKLLYFAVFALPLPYDVQGNNW